MSDRKSEDLPIDEVTIKIFRPGRDMSNFPKALQGKFWVMLGEGADAISFHNLHDATQWIADQLEGDWYGGEEED